MAHILEFIRHDVSFDPEALKAVGAAYDLAVANMQGGEQPKIVREIIAQRIIASAKTGERNPQKLCQMALRGIVQGLEKAQDR